MYALEVEHLTVHFEGAERPAVDDVSFALAPGQMVMLIGPNGSGKTTLLRAILSLIPSRGVVKVYGQPIREAYALIGYVPQHLRFDPSLPLTGREMLHMPLQPFRDAYLLKRAHIRAHRATQHTQQFQFRRGI